MANLSRILAWWREVDWRACAAYSIAGIPAAALGARTLLALPSRAVDISIGVFPDTPQLFWPKDINPAKIILA